MNYTEKHHLPQWVKTDRIMMDDFNQMCTDIEAGLENVASGAAAANAQTAANAALQAQNAQATANKAVQDAAKAQAKADAAYAPDQPPYAVGTYVGNGSSRAIQLGFRPRFVIVSGGTVEDTTLFAGEQTGSDHLRIVDTGFTVSPRTGSSALGSGEYPPYMSKSGVTYNYIAFR